MFFGDGEELVALRCGQCGCRFGMTAFMQKRRAEDKETFYCPNGHPRAYVESEADKLRRERDRLQQQIACKDDEIKSRDRQIKKMKKREAAGTCPCCQRTFSNMAQHMKQQHPQFVADSGAKVVPIKRAAKLQTSGM